MGWKPKKKQAVESEPLLGDLGGLESRRSSYGTGLSGSEGRKRRRSNHEAVEFSDAPPVGEKSSKKKRPPKTSIGSLFRFANGIDVALMVLGSVLAIANGLLQPLNTIITGQIVNVLLNSKPLEGRELWEEARPDVYGFFVLGVIILLVSVLQAICWHMVCERQIRRLRNAYLRGVLRQNIAWYDENRSGTLTTQLTDNIDRMKEGMGDKIGVLFQGCAQFFAGFGIAFFYSWKMTLVMLSVIPALVILAIIMAKKTGEASRKEAEGYGVAGAIAEEVLANIRTVIAFNGQKREIKRYEGQLKIARAMGVRKAVITGLSLGVFFFFLFSSFGLSFWFGGNLYLSGELLPGDVFTVFMAVMSGAMALSTVSPCLSLLATSRAVAVPVYNVIDRVPEIDSRSSDGFRGPISSASIAFDNIDFSYPARPDVQVLKQLSLRLEAGQTVALVGPSGSGKSTMFNLIQRFYDPWRGSISIDGIDTREFNVKSLRNLIGVVSQEPVLFNATIEENLRMGNESITEEEMVDACKMSNAHQFISDLPEGYKTVLGDRGVLLSGGQKQRIAIARALTRNPKILLLDEATSALDVESEQLVQTALDKASKGRTTLVIAHRLSTVKNADVIVVMQNGEIVETGRHKELLKKEDGVYRQLVEAQAFKVPEKTSPVTAHERPVFVGFQRQHSDSSNVSTDESEITAMSRSQVNSRQLSRNLSRTAGKQDEQADRLKRELAEEGLRRSSWFHILSTAKKDIGILGVAIFFSIVRGLMMPFFSLAFGQIFQGFELRDPDQMAANSVFTAFIFVALGAIQGTSAFFCLTLYGVGGERLTMRLRVMAFRALLRQDTAYFDDPRHASGRLTTRLATDAPNVRAALDQRMASIVQGVVSIVSGVLLSFFIGWQMALIAVAVYAVLYGVKISLDRYIRKRDRQDIYNAEDAGRIAIESIEAARTIQSLTREDYQFAKFHDSMKKTYHGQTLKAIMQSFVYGTATSMGLFASSLAYGYGIYLISVGAMTPYAVYEIVTALNMSTMGIMSMATYWPEIMKARLAAGLIFSMINSKPKIDVEDETGLRNKLFGDVALRDVHFVYPSRPERQVLQGIHLGTQAGKSLAIVGPSGCGKSTIVSLIARLYDPRDGRVEFDAFDAKTMHVKTLRSQMATVSQEPVLFDTTIRENIAYGCDAVGMERIQQAARQANIHDAIMALPQAYDTRVGEQGSQLSGGQKQRIAIARAIVRDPRILLLDEATSALDSESERVVQAALDKAATGRTCIAIAHRLSSIQNYDTIVVIKHGRVMESGTHEELLEAKGIYYSMVKKQKIL
ncbi:hypothetical protein QR680_018274 [Steinernema hermaphroditum]|uniref:ABC-type xenobiotic transporter n=1 Tax=Steinernema hermaphroditum TaxID=289476 RepID=A0AA39HI96_9BILA|nr:hypothetical protein QR680_018274 [Steinernema hermaphroditum]